MDRNVLILVFLVFLYVISKMVSDKIQLSDCQEQLMTFKGVTAVDTEICCSCVLDQMRQSQFKLLDEQLKTKGISNLLTVEDPLLDTFDIALTDCVKNKSNYIFAFTNSQKDSLGLVCQKEYEGTGFDQEVNITQYCNCYVEEIQKNISVRDLLKLKINFADNRAINTTCTAQSKIAKDTIQ